MGCHYLKDKTPYELLEEEKINLLPNMPLYETATTTEVRVSKYSTIMMIKISIHFVYSFSLKTLPFILIF